MDVNFYDKNRDPFRPNPNDIILGRCFGIYIEHRGKLTCNGTYDESPLMHFMIEDDGNWFIKDVSMDINWIDDIMDVMSAAKNR